MGTQLFFIAGHNKSTDPGARAYDGSWEADYTVDLRDRIIREVITLKDKDMGSALSYVHQAAGTSMQDNDTLSLVQTINWLNKVAHPKDLALDIHMNYNAEGVSGCEAFYSQQTNPTNKDRAEKLCALVAEVLGTKNRGAKSEILSNPGRLGICSDTKCQVLLLEPAFLSAADLPNYLSKRDELAKAIANFYYSELCK